MVLVVACNGGEPHDCDKGTPTCESQLLVSLPDSRTQFTLHVHDELGMQIDMDCPAADGLPAQFDAYSAECLAGQLRITTYLPFGDQVVVQLEEGLEKTYSPTYQRGGDYCGNECDQGNIQL
jgi:hypothetical protein